MATNEGLKPLQSDSIAPTDPNVRIPDHVKAAAAAADQIHQAAYQQEAALEKPVPQVESPPLQPQPEPQQAQPQPEPQRQPPQAGDENVSAEEWRHRFLSMQGRFQAAQRSVGSMEQQMAELGQELVRTQQLVTQLSQGQAQPGQTAAPQHHQKLITDEDRQSYGDELLDTIRRTALDTLNPEIERLRAETEQMRDRVRVTGKRELFATLERSVPNWRAINNSIQFKTWCRLPNIYTGQVRGEMLKAAVDGADAPKAIALFKDFLTEAAATGQMAPTSQNEPQAQPAPRVAAMDLETLAAPGRARPASGDSQVPSEKPTYTRAYISNVYAEKRKGLWDHRLADFQAFENDLGAAQREGRIR